MGGLFLSSITLFILVLSILLGFDQFKSLIITPKNIFVIEFTVIFLNLIVWSFSKYSKNIVPANRKQLNVAINIEYHNESKNLYKKAIETFKRKFKEIDINNEFNIFEISINKKFLNDRDAEEFILNEKINLLIWGYTEEGKVQNLDTTIFHLRFSYNFITAGRSYEEHSEQYKNFTQDINNALIGRLWEVTRPNTLPDLRVVSENISEISLYIIIKAITSYGLWRVALKYCDELLTMLKRYNSPNLFPRFNEFEDIVKQMAADLSNSISYHYSVIENDFKTARDYSSKALTYVDNFFPALINLARISWLLGNREEAKKFTKIARKQNASSALVRLNHAFFALEEGRFKSAVATYKKIKNVPQGLNIFDVTTFLYSVFEKTQEPSYLFGSGVLNLHFGDKIEGKKELEQFLNLANKEKNKYIILINYTQGILSSLKNQ